MEPNFTKIVVTPTPSIATEGPSPRSSRERALLSIATPTKLRRGGSTGNVRKVLVCVYCGGDFGDWSLEHHLPRCRERWRQERDQWPNHLQVATPHQVLPSKPLDELTETERDKLNATVSQIFRDVSMLKCRTCNRRFDTFEKLEKHNRSCGADDFTESNRNRGQRRGLARAASGALQTNEPQKPFSRSFTAVSSDTEQADQDTTASALRQGPRMFVCCFCGLEYSAWSLRKHAPNCRTRWMREREQLPTSIQLPIPDIPPLDSLECMTEDERTLFNTQARNTRKANCCVPCQFCDRTFDSLEKMSKHLNNCADAIAAQKTASRAGSPQPQLTVPSDLAGPRMFVCAFCGLEFSYASLPIHQPQCLEKWKRAQENLPSTLQADMPPTLARQLSANDLREMTNSERRTFNRQNSDLFRDHSMVGCGCGRRFATLEKLRKHQADCTDARDAPPPKPRRKGSLDSIAVHKPPSTQQHLLAPSSPHLVRAHTDRPSAAEMSGDEEAPFAPREQRLPKMFVCCFCGLEFSSRSIRRHSRRCRTRWIVERAQLPTSLQLPLPDPPCLDGLEKLTEDERTLFNAQARNTFKTNCCVPCQFCSRTFYSLDKMSKHLNGCTEALAAQKTAAKVSTPRSAPTTPRESGPRMFVCAFCGKEFSYASLPIHQPQCMEKWQQERESFPPMLGSESPLTSSRQLSADELGAMSFTERQSFNKQNSDLFREHAMKPCACGRRFRTNQKLRDHQAHCAQGDVSPVQPLRQRLNLNSTSNESSVPFSRAFTESAVVGLSSSLTPPHPQTHTPSRAQPSSSLPRSSTNTTMGSSSAGLQTAPHTTDSEFGASGSPKISKLRLPSLQEESPRRSRSHSPRRSFHLAEGIANMFKRLPSPSPRRTKSTPKNASPTAVALFVDD